MKQIIIITRGQETATYVDQIIGPHIHLMVDLLLVFRNQSVYREW